MHDSDNSLCFASPESNTLGLHKSDCSYNKFWRENNMQRWRSWVGQGSSSCTRLVLFEVKNY